MSDPWLQETMEQPGLSSMSAEDFRKAYPTWPEDVLRNPANPEWFVNNEQTAAKTDGSENSATDNEDERWARFYRRER